MRPYDRATFKRLTASEAAHATTVEGGAAAATARAAVPPGWERFLAVLADAAEVLGEDGERRAVARLVGCGGATLGRGFACGAEGAALEAWCGHPLCPVCARARAGEAARAAASGWSERLLEVFAPIGGAARVGLPSRASVDAVRAGWAQATAGLAQATGLSRLEKLPRAVVDPRGVTLFARFPWSVPAPRAAQDCLAAEVTRACRRVGLTVEARAVSREAATITLSGALRAEAERFAGEVAGDLARFDALTWRGGYAGDASLEAALRALARRWLERVGRRAATARRTTVLGARHALPVPAPRRPAFAPAVCADHGQGCRAVSTFVRARGRTVRFDDLRLPRAPSASLVAAFVLEARKATPVPIALAPIELRSRRAA